MKTAVRATLAACVLAICLTLPSYAKKQAESINFGSITCKEFLADIQKSDDDTVGIIFMWLDGYLSGVSGDTKLNFDNLERFSGQLISSCSKKPGAKVLDVAKAVGINR